MAFENSKGSKKCPLCVYLIKREDLKRVIVTQAPVIKIGSKISLNLMVRSKASQIIKSKILTQSTSLPLKSLPTIDQPEYQETRLLLANYCPDYLTESKLKLEEHIKYLESCQEPELIEFVQESLDYIETLHEQNDDMTEEKDSHDIQKRKSELPTQEEDFM